MVEWSITTVLKTVVPRGTGGSNPSLSATNAENQQIAKQTPSFAPKNVKSGVFVLFKINHRNVTEFSLPKVLTYRLRVDIYFTDPYSGMAERGNQAHPVIYPKRCCFQHRYATADKGKDCSPR